MTSKEAFYGFQGKVSKKSLKHLYNDGSKVAMS